MIRACSARTDGGCEWDIIRKPTVSSPSSRAIRKCWTEMSASLQWVAMRMIETPRSATAWMSSAVPIPGSSKAAIRACLAVATAVAISSRSGVPEKP